MVELKQSWVQIPPLQLPNVVALSESQFLYVNWITCKNRGFGCKGSANLNSIC